MNVCILSMLTVVLVLDDKKLQPTFAHHTTLRPILRRFTRKYRQSTLASLKESQGSRFDSKSSLCFTMELSRTDIKCLCTERLLYFSYKLLQGSF